MLRTVKYFPERAKRASIPKALAVLKRAGVGNLRGRGVIRYAASRQKAEARYDTTLSGATFSASRFSPIARAMKRAVIGVPS